MLDTSTLVVFIGAGLALLIVPGPAVMYIVAQSVDQGRVAGIVSVLGIATGSLVHIGAAALGISAILVTSAAAFAALKYIGAAYLIYLGVRKLMEQDAPDSVEPGTPQPLAASYRQGVVVNVLNPKTALFFFAFLPQFVDPARGSAAVQVLLLGAIFTIMGILSDGLYAVIAGSVGEFIKRSRALKRGQRLFSGGVYITLGLTTALLGNNRAK